MFWQWLGCDSTLCSVAQIMLEKESDWSSFKLSKNFVSLLLRKLFWIGSDQSLCSVFLILRYVEFFKIVFLDRWKFWGLTVEILEIVVLMTTASCSVWLPRKWRKWKLNWNWSKIRLEILLHFLFLCCFQRPKRQ